LVVDHFTGVVSTVFSLQERRVAEGLDCYVPLIFRNGRIADADADLDRFFLDLPLNGVRSAHSLRAYGYDILGAMGSRKGRCGGRPASVQAAT
jgi:hypothetical protein